MNENETPCWFDWNEIVDVFSIPEEDALDEKNVKNSCNA